MKRLGDLAGIRKLRPFFEGWDELRRLEKVCAGGELARRKLGLVVFLGLFWVYFGAVVHYNHSNEDSSRSTVEGGRN